MIRSQKCICVSESLTGPGTGKVASEFHEPPSKVCYVSQLEVKVLTERGNFLLEVSPIISILQGVSLLGPH